MCINQVRAPSRLREEANYLLLAPKENGKNQTLATFWLPPFNPSCPVIPSAHLLRYDDGNLQFIATPRPRFKAARAGRGIVAAEEGRSRGGSEE